MYIHSSPVNFAYVAGSMYNQRVYDGNELTAVKNELDDAEKILRSQIDKITQLSNEFYTDLQLNAYDSYSIAADGEISFHLNGAKEFERRYLTLNSNNVGNSITQKLLSIMNTKDYQNECIRTIKAIFDGRGGKLTPQKSQEFKDLINIIGQSLGKKFLKGINNLPEITFKEVQKALSKMMEVSKRARKSSSNTIFKVEVQKDIFSNLEVNNTIKEIFVDKNGDLFKLSTIEGAQKAKEKFEDYFKGMGIKNTVDVLWDVLIKKDQSIKGLINENDFKAFFITELQGYGNVSFTTGGSHFVGMQGEQPFIFGMTIDLDKLFKNSLTPVKIRGLGQQFETKTFADNSSGTYMSGSDFIFDTYDANGNIKKSYRIQAKNSFEESNFLNVRLQDKIKLQTYVDRIFEQDSQEKKNLFEYLLLNRAFLTQYGLAPGHWQKYDSSIQLVNNKAEMNYKQDLHKELESYILFFLNETLAYLIGGKVYEAAKYNWNLDKQNLFFIYKGKYLIPVSLFLYSAYRLIAFLKSELKVPVNLKNGIHITGTIGELTYSSKLEGVNVGMAFARKLRSDKYYYLNHRTDLIFEEDHGLGTIFDSGYRYPENLVEIGHQAGEQLLEQASFPKINFRMHLQEIDKFLK